MVYEKTRWKNKRRSGVKPKPKAELETIGKEDQEEQNLYPKYARCDQLMDRIYRSYHRPFEKLQDEGIEPWPYPAA